MKWGSAGGYGNFASGFFFSYPQKSSWTGEIFGMCSLNVSAMPIKIKVTPTLQVSAAVDSNLANSFKDGRNEAATSIEPGMVNFMMLNRGPGLSSRVGAFGRSC